MCHQPFHVVLWEIFNCRAKDLIKSADSLRFFCDFESIQQGFPSEKEDVQGKWNVVWQDFFNFFVFQDNSRRGFRDIFLSFFVIFVQALVLAVIRNCLYSSIRAKTMFHGFLVKSVDGIHRLLIYFGLSFTRSRCRGGVALIGVTVG